MKTHLLTLVAAVAMLFAANGQAQAQISVDSGSSLGFGGFGGTRITTIWDLYRTGQIPIPPYFAINPPVYYSHVIPQPYGWSQFPFPGYSQRSPIVTSVEPEMVLNPYVPSSSSEPATDETVLNPHATKPTPLVIHNPYVREQSRVMAASLSH